MIYIKLTAVGVMVGVHVGVYDGSAVGDSDGTGVSLVGLCT